MNIDSKAILAAFSAMLCIVCVGLVAIDDGADAATSGSGTVDNPFIAEDSDLTGSSADLYNRYDSLYDLHSELYFVVEPGKNVSISISSLTPISDVVGNSVSLDSNYLLGDTSEDFSFTMDYRGFSPCRFIFTVLEPEEEVDFTSPDSVESVSKSTISYSAATNIPATFAEVGGSAASWLDVDSSTSKVTGQAPTVSTKTTYTYVIEATSTGDPTNKTQQTITVDVWPVAQITASQRVADIVQNDVFSGITLSGNIDMTFSVKSGKFPEGISMTPSGVISGTPTEFGQSSITVEGVTSEGPEQRPTIVIVLTVDEDEPVLSISVGTPEGPYKVGTSLSFPLTSNVAGTVWQVSGTASSWMSVSGSNVVGSVPSSYDEIAEVTLEVSAQTPQGQSAFETITFSVEPIISFTTVPTADCVIIPVYQYNDDGTPVISSGMPLFTEVYADSADFSFSGTLTICGTFTGENADTVTWYWGDGSSDVGNKVEHSYSEPGTYTIKLVASNDVGSDTIEITVSVGPSSPISDFVSLILLALIVIVLIAAACHVARCRSGSHGRRD